MAAAMNDPERVPADGSDDQNPPKAKAKRSWWLGWIWLLPIATLCVVGYFGITALFSRGPTVRVVFPGAPDIKAGDTKVKFQNQVVGDVESVTLQTDLQHTDVKLSLNARLSGHLGPDTRFWIEGGNLSLNDLSELKTLVSGPFIGVDPRPGKETDRFTGLSEKPVLAQQPPGRHYHLHAATLGTISRGSPVLYLGVKVGEVISTGLAPDGHGVDIEAFVRSPHDKLVHDGTRFWDASAVQLATGGGGPRVQFQSLPALVSGALAFGTPPEARDRPTAADDTAFPLYPGQSAAENAPSPNAQAYQVVFANPSGMLSPGASVTLAGKRVGSINESSLDYDADAGKLLLHATLMLEPEQMRIEHGSGTVREQMDAMLERLIGQGLRAGLESSPPVVGSRQIALRFVPNAPPAALGSGSRPEIPTTSGAGIDSIMAQASDVMAKIDSLPFNQIADNLQQTTQRLAELSQSPETKEALQNVNDAVANLRRVSASMSRDLPAALSRTTRAIQSAQAMIGQEGEVANQPQTSTLPSTLFEVRQAARSIRELANELERNPQALLTGK